MIEVQQFRIISGSFHSSGRKTKYSSTHNSVRIHNKPQWDMRILLIMAVLAILGQPMAGNMTQTFQLDGKSNKPLNSLASPPTLGKIWAHSPAIKNYST